MTVPDNEDFNWVQARHDWSPEKAGDRLREKLLADAKQHGISSNYEPSVSWDQVSATLTIRGILKTAMVSFHHEGVSARIQNSSTMLDLVPVLFHDGTRGFTDADGNQLRLWQASRRILAPILFG